MGRTCLHTLRWVQGMQLRYGTTYYRRSVQASFYKTHQHSPTGFSWLTAILVYVALHRSAARCADDVIFSVLYTHRRRQRGLHAAAMSSPPCLPVAAIGRGQLDSISMAWQMAVGVFPKIAHRMELLELANRHGLRLQGAANQRQGSCSEASSPVVISRQAERSQPAE